MDTSIWSQLPTEILLLLIECSDDEETSRNWCRATRCSANLWPRALAHAWTSAAVTASDLVAAPNHYPLLSPRPVPEEDLADGDDDSDDEDKLNPSRRTVAAALFKHNAVNPESLLNELLSPNPSGVRPAHFIHDLVLDLRIQTFPSNYPSQPSEEVIIYTLSRLFPQLRAVENLSVDGPVGDWFVEAISKHIYPEASPKFKRLTVRKQYTKYHYYSDKFGERPYEPADGRLPSQEGGYLPPEGAPPRLNLAILLPTLKQQLQWLEINQLGFGESQYLVKAIGGLEALQGLSVRVRKRNSDDDDLPHPAGPLRELLSTAEWRNEGVVIVSGNLLESLPLGLKRLELRDHFSDG